MAEASQLDISRLERKIDNLSKYTEETTNRLNGISTSIDELNGELNALAVSFQQMMVEQKKTAALQQAMTELVRVRQELEQNFGNYKVVRETMLGVLQATDLALVKKTTISRVSEELMLSTPKYWLAPCLVAVSAWIGNDRDLAERAIAEAVKRDEERTALTMALICRRNNKVQTCYEWLAIYFAKQDAANFSEGTFTYIDAYVNGVFGPDEKHVCDDYITKWINEIRGNSSLFEKQQEEFWTGYCDRFNRGIAEIYPDLKDCVQEYDQIDAYVGRINSVDAIANNFSTIANAYVDQERLKATIDKNLIMLVSRYDEEEEPLRKEESYLKKVKEYNGDAEAAKRAIIASERSRQERALNLVEQMSRVLTAEEDVSPSEKKTAMSFLNSYIKKGFDNYIVEKKNEFPENITMNLYGWKGVTSDGNNYAQLCGNYDNYLAQCCEEEVKKANTSSPRNWIIGALVSIVLAVVMSFAATPIGVLMLFVAIFCALKSVQSKNAIKANIAGINQKYADMSAQGKNKISACIQEWNHAKGIAYNFDEEATRNVVLV